LIRFAGNVFINALKSCVSANRGAIAPKALIAVATLLLSVCASVFTFVALTRVEAWMANGRTGSGGAAGTGSGYESAAKNPPQNAGANNRYGDAATLPATEAPPPAADAPSFSITDYHAPSFSTTAPATESIFRETNAETEEDELVMRQLMEDMSIIPPARPADRPYRGRVPPPQSSIQTSPKSGSGVPFMINNASTGINLFALTFDGGSSANAADDILDTLASRGVKSTVFLTGAFIKRYPQTVMRIAAEGHELGNHTMNHPRLTTYAENRTQATRHEISRASLISELTAAERLLFEQTEGLRFAPLWRAPYGEYNQEICEWALSAGYIHIGWRQGGAWRVNLDSNDWVTDESSPAYKTPQEIFDKIINIASNPGGLNGGIILMHLGTERRQRSRQAHTILGKLIDTLVSMGYKPVTVSTLLYKSGVDIDLVRF
jgi:peptidoglycan/xylan/chitin deacetylase (PgdA/CDA1 family)